MFSLCSPSQERSSGSESNRAKLVHYEAGNTPMNVTIVPGAFLSLWKITLWSISMLNDSQNPAGFYKLLVSQAAALTEDEPLVLPNLSNTAALLGESLSGINWSGYYLLKDDILILGPFWGRPACIRIPMGKGVCGTAALKDEIQCVKDVHAFPGHIACDSRSRSEIVLPIHYAGKVIGVLDIDSPELARFDESDVQGLSEFVKVLEQNCDWSGFRVG